MCWLIDASNDIFDDPSAVTISELYEQCKFEIQAEFKNTHSSLLPLPLSHLDRNGGEFELILRKMSANKQDQLCVKHIRFFAHCTSNLNPQLKAIVRQRRGVHTSLIDFDSDFINNSEPSGPKTSSNITGNLIDLGVGVFLFEDSSIWTKNEELAEERGLEKETKILCKMSISEVVQFVKKLNIKPDCLATYIDLFYSNNLNGLVLQTCDLNDLKSVLKVFKK